MNWRRWLIAVWVCFVIRSFFYSAALPLWEGFDEWSYFSVIRRVAFNGEALVSRSAPIPRDVQATIDLAPLPWELRHYSPPSLDADRYWRLPAEQRKQRLDAFRSIPMSWQRENATGNLVSYEALQPPLYAWLMAPVMLALKRCGVAAQVTVIRWVSGLLASLTIPIVFLVARFVLANDAAGLSVAAIVALMPEYAIDVSRVGNECVAVPLFTALTYLLVKIASLGFTRRRALLLGIVLGLGLLAKAYFLTGVPAAVAVMLYAAVTRRRYSLIPLAITTASSAAIAGWWYIHNLFTTGTLSGLNEALMTRHAGQLALLAKVPDVHWLGAIDSILFSHLWFGGWSSLTVRSWIYHVFYVAILIAAAGLLRVVRQTPVATLAVVYACFWLGQLYNVLLLFSSKGQSTSMGWYMYAVVGAEVTLCVAGWRAILPPNWRQWAGPAGVFLFAALDLYTMNAVALPYCSGMIAHQANGHLAALHLRDIARMGIIEEFARLAAYKQPLINAATVLTLWLLYLAATIAPVAMTSYLARLAHARPADWVNSASGV